MLSNQIFSELLTKTISRLYLGTVECKNVALKRIKKKKKREECKRYLNPKVKVIYINCKLEYTTW